MFESVKRVTGTADADWAVSHETAADRMVAAQALMARGDRRGFGMASMQLHETFCFLPLGNDGSGEKRRASDLRFAPCPSPTLRPFILGSN